ncbi:MAG: cytochrome c [Epsilonproteobacteria bacterium]|nr:cytochrome c [Campylobacterota bacterium]
MKKMFTSFLLFLLFTLGSHADNGKKVFETYCWGCHHQTAMAFGPSFTTIASKRTAQEIAAMITDPEGVSKVFGYKRNAMPALKLNPEELQAITTYILSFKDVSDEDNASKKEQNKTIIEEPYLNIATAKETH